MITGIAWLAISYIIWWTWTIFVITIIELGSAVHFSCIYFLECHQNNNKYECWSSKNGQNIDLNGSLVTRASFVYVRIVSQWMKRIINKFHVIVFQWNIEHLIIFDKKFLSSFFLQFHMWIKRSSMRIEFV